MKKLKLWFENYWYHYKYHTLIGLLAVITVTVALTQCAKNRECDAYLSYAGGYVPSSAEQRKLEDAFSACLPGDLSGDGERSVSVNTIFYMSADEIRARLDTEPEFVVKDALLAENLETFDREFEAGDTAIWLVSPSLYARKAATDEWVSLLEIMDSMPKGADGPYSVVLADTDFGRYYLSFLPGDTLICMRRESNYSVITGREESGEAYSRAVELFNAVLDFRIPE